MEATAAQASLKPIVFVVDDDEAIRSGIADLIEAMGLAVKTFGTAEEFLTAHDPAQPGCLILDLQMPGMGGLELQTMLSEKGLRLPIIIITGHGDIAASVRSMKLGAIDFLEKPFREHTLSECIRKALARDALTRTLESEQATFQQQLSLLTDRERQVMDLIITGKSDKQISLELQITQRAVAFHRLHLLAKMHTPSIAELTMLAAKARLAR